MRWMTSLTPRERADPGVLRDFRSGRAICIARSTQADCLAAADRSVLIDDGALAVAGAAASAAPMSAEAPSAAVRPRRGLEDMGTFSRVSSHDSCDRLSVSPIYSGVPSSYAVRMSQSGPLDDVVSQQYERWMYPAPISDLPAWSANNWQWFDPSHAHRLFWPDRAYPEGLDILVAGCGTNQAAVIAFTNPTAHVMAIDVSDASLAHHRHLKEAYGLINLELHRLPIEEVASLHRDFDLIISTGVLHHLDDPQRGLRALAQCLRVDGVLALMLYATYGRIGVRMMQSVFNDLGLRQDAPSLGIVREAMSALDPMHPLGSYLGIAPDLDDDAGLIDTFLHGRERTYTIDECQDLVVGAGLVFQDLLFKAPYYAPRGTDNAFFDAIAARAKEQQWSLMERIHTRNACHFFMACRPDRSTDAYVIDLDGDAAMGYVPFLRHSCRLEGDKLHRHDWQLTLNPEQVLLVQLMDGRSTLAEIASTAIDLGQFPVSDPDDVSRRVRDFAEQLWLLDFVALGVR